MDVLRALGLDVWYDVTPVVIAAISAYAVWYYITYEQLTHVWYQSGNNARIDGVTQRACQNVAATYTDQYSQWAGQGAVQDNISKTAGNAYKSLGCPDPGNYIPDYLASNCKSLPNDCPQQLFTDPGCAAMLPYLKTMGYLGDACSHLEDCLSNTTMYGVNTIDADNQPTCLSACNLKCAGTNGCCGYLADIYGKPSPCLTAPNNVAKQTCTTIATCDATNPPLYAHKNPPCGNC
jgi:hypothetical protein